jgi:NAD(P)-dependent dehydrogenase (short-subunit alcohol dehydrogenase family)
MLEASSAVLVTGAKGSIGSAIVDALIGQDFRVVALDKRYEARTLDLEKRVLFEPFDITSVMSEDVNLAAYITELLALIGATELKGLVNNAAHQHVSPYYKVQKSEWTKTFETNVFAPVLLASATRDLLKASSGAIVNIGSVHEVSSKSNFSAYAASKSALSAITRGMNLDERGAIRIFAVAPGAVDTPMLREGFDSEEAFSGLKEFQPLGRIATPAEVANVVVELITKGSSLLSGSTLRLDGGIHGKLHDPA